MPIVPVTRLSGALVPTAAARVNPRPRTRPVRDGQEPATPQSVTSDPDYKVGYKCPPLHTRFKDRSGNPRGRPKGAKGLKTMVRALLTQKVKVRTPDGLKSMTKMEAMLHKILEQAFSGNLRALQSFIVLYQQAVPDEPADGAATVAAPVAAADLDTHDRAMLDELRSTLAAELGDDR